MKQQPKACTLGEAGVEEVRQVERVVIDGVQHWRLDEDLKEDPDQLEVGGGEQRFVAEDDVKDVPEGYTDVRPLFVLRRDHIGDGVDEQVERENVEAGRFGSVSGAPSTVSRVMSAIVSK